MIFPISRNFHYQLVFEGLIERKRERRKRERRERERREREEREMKILMKF